VSGARPAHQTFASTYHIDTDMGVDDGLALLVADRLLPAISGLSCVFGNVPLETAVRNALLFRELLGKSDSWRILRGADRPSKGEAKTAADVHGDDGLGGATKNVNRTTLEKIAAIKIDMLEDIGSSTNGNVVIIGIGPATNIPKLVSLYGRPHVRKIVLMAGSFFDVGNITEFAEFNAFSDPKALEETINLGIPVTLVPLDVCRKIQLSRSTMKNFGRNSRAPVAELLMSSHMAYMDFYQNVEGIDGCFPHDSIAVIAALHPELFFSLRGHVTVDPMGQTTIECDDKSHVEVLTGGNLRWVRETIKAVLS
jgi:purine nucleosidase